jgi:ketosteroid isomerase-like protein
VHNDSQDLVQAFYGRAEKGDVDHILELLADDVSWGVPEALPYGGTYHGHEGFRRYRAQIAAHFEPGYRFEKTAIFHCDGQVVVLGRLTGSASATSLPIDTRFAHFWTVEDGHVASRYYHLNTTAMLHSFTGSAANGDAEAEQVVTGVYEATGAGDTERVLQLLHPDVDWQLPESLPYGGQFSGHDGVQETRRRSGEVFAATPTFAREHMFQSSSDFVVTGTMTGKLRDGGPVEAPFVHIWTVRDGKVAARRQYTDTAAMAQALGSVSSSP